MSVIATAGIVSAAPSGVAVAADPTDLPTAGLAMVEPRAGHTATLLADGSILIAGGQGGADIHASAEIYDPGARHFEPTGSLERARILHSATALPDGRVLIIGGMSQRAPARAAVELYDPLDGEFTSGGRLRKARAGHTATLLDGGRVLVVGGTGKDADSGPHASAELYDPATGLSGRAGRSHHARAYHTATLLYDGTVLLVGGVAFDAEGGGEVVASSELYDPETDRFTSAGSLTNARWQHTASRLDDGTVLVVGGVDDESAPLASAELYDPVSRRFTAIADLEQAAVLHTSTLLDDGRVLVIGGYGGVISYAEIYDPEARAFTDTGSLRSPRNGHRATRLDDGTVLITGGWGSSWPLDSAELFDPTTMRVVAFGPADPAADGFAAAPTPAPLPPLGGIVGGGRIEMAGSAFAMTFPVDWTVEVADPDPDVFSAAPGTAWEALRAHDPERLQACSVSVGVATRSLKNQSGVASGSTTTVPRWDEEDTTLLWAPEPRVESKTGGVGETVSPRQRLHGSDPRLEHDVMYAVSCSAGDAGAFDADEQELDNLIDTLEFLPSRS